MPAFGHRLGVVDYTYYGRMGLDVYVGTRTRYYAGNWETIVQQSSHESGVPVTPPYFTDKPAWDCFSGLLAWAAHEEHRDSVLPTVAPDDWSTNDAVQRSSQAEGFKSRYGQLLHGPELWLPGSSASLFARVTSAGTPSPLVRSVRYSLNSAILVAARGRWTPR